MFRKGVRKCVIILEVGKKERKKFGMKRVF